MRSRLYVVDPVSQLYTIDPATGSPSLVGPTGVGNITDIAFHGPTLYAVSFAQLLRLNPDTGAATAVGPLGFPTTNGLAAASDGTLYASTINGQLIRINPATGAGTLVGTFGGGLTSSGDLVCDSNDTLFGALNSGASTVLARIDRNTGAATVIGPTGLSTLYGLALHCCRLYGVTSAGELVDINVATGRATVIARDGLTNWGMTARPCCGC